MKNLGPPPPPCYPNNVSFRLLVLAVVAMASLSGCATLDDVFSDPAPVVYVHDSPGPRVYDPYYNRPKYWDSRPVYYAPAPSYYETKSKKKKGNKVTTTTQVRNQWGDVVYQNKETKTKKSSDHSSKKKKKK